MELRVHPTILVASLLLVAAGAGCKSAPDGGAGVGACAHADECDSGLCIESRCHSECTELPGWTTCDARSEFGTFSRGCCSPNEHCCYRGGEYYSCAPVSIPCPVDCHTNSTCDPGTRCIVGTTGPVDSQGCGRHWSDGCEANCALELQCGQSYCCGEGTRCNIDLGCCVVQLNAGAD